MPRRSGTARGAFESMSPRHIRAVSSSSRRSPVETTSSPAAGVVESCDRPRLRVVRRSTPASVAPRTPRCRRRASPVSMPEREMARARLTLNDDFPTPPLPLETAMTRVCGLIMVGDADSRARRRTLPISSERCDVVIAVTSTETDLDGGNGFDLSYDVVFDLVAALDRRRPSVQRRSTRVNHQDRFRSPCRVRRCRR